MICSICGQEICGSYYFDYWKNNFCANHYENGEVATCSSCSAMIHKSTVLSLSDGRCLCQSCQAQVISTDEQVAKIKKIVVRKLVDEGVRYKDKYLDSVPVKIVTVNELARLRNTPPNLNNKGITITKGISSPIGSLIGFSPIMSHKVYILNNLIKIEFAGTLAHELMHVWQNENQIKLPPPSCEGLCNLGSWLIYTTISASKASFFVKCLMESPDPIYGDGFRHVFQIYEKTGWDGVLDKARKGVL